jgi:peptide chain release factor 1
MLLPLDEIIAKYEENNQKMAEITDTKKLIEFSKGQKKVQNQRDLAVRIKELNDSILKNQELLGILNSNEQEMIDLTKEDILEKEQEVEKLSQKLLEELAPADAKDDENIYLEIRAGAGGDESSLFAAEMLRMYSYLAESLGFKLKIISFNENSLGGYKEIIAEIRGEGVYSWFKYEGGVHRVQRVPETEKQGRVHTSTVSVAIMPLVEGNSDFKLNMDDVEIMIAMASGNGGQSVNTTYSAVKMRHKPTGLEAAASEKNQIQNRENCIKILTARVFDYYEQIRLAKEADKRKDQVGQADRSEKIRTYNFPQDRMTDHRYNNNWNQLPEILKGKILEVIQDIKRFEAKATISSLKIQN